MTFIKSQVYDYTIIELLDKVKTNQIQYSKMGNSTDKVLNALTLGIPLVIYVKMIDKDNLHTIKGDVIINTLVNFYQDEITVKNSIHASIKPYNNKLSSKKYSELDLRIKTYIDKLTVRVIILEHDVLDANAIGSFLQIIN